MPTFDFANVIRRLVSAALSAVASPITAVLAISSAITLLFDDIIKFFGEDLTLPQLSFEPLSLTDSADSLLRVFLYAVDFNTLVEIVNFILGFFQKFIIFSCSFVVSFIGVVVAVGAVKVVRKQLKDVMGG